MDTPRTFSTKKVTTTSRGIAGAARVSHVSKTPERMTSTTNATNQRSDRRTPMKSSAPIGAVKAQSDTALELTKPPRLHCNRKGSASIMTSWLMRNIRYRLVRAKWARLTADATWYASGMAAERHSPRAPYVTTQTTDNTGMSVDDSVSVAFVNRSASESEGSAPSRASRSTQLGRRPQAVSDGSTICFVAMCSHRSVARRAAG